MIDCLKYKLKPLIAGGCTINVETKTGIQLSYSFFVAKAAEDSEVVNESENEDEESLIMSQPLWPDEGLSSDPAGSLQRSVTF